MAGELLIDAVDTGASHGIWISGEPDQWLDPPPATFQVAQLSGRAGAIVSPQMEIGPRRLLVPVRILGTTPTTRRNSEQWLKNQYGREVVVRVNGDDGATRQIRGVIERIALKPLKRVVTQTSYGSITVLCGDPFWQEVTATDLTVSGETTIAFGTAPVRHWSLAATGTFTDLTAVIKDADDNVLHTLAWVGTATAETLTIDSANGIVDLDGTNEFLNYSGGFPELDPREVDSITVTFGSGSATVVLSFRKRDH
jgi:hypothetical protein